MDKKDSECFCFFKTIVGSNILILDYEIKEYKYKQHKRFQELIELAWGIPREIIALIFAGRDMYDNDDNSIDNYSNLQHFSTLHMIVRNQDFVLQKIIEKEKKTKELTYNNNCPYNNNNNNNMLERYCERYFFLPAILNKSQQLRDLVISNDSQSEFQLVLSEPSDGMKYLEYEKIKVASYPNAITIQSWGNFGTSLEGINASSNIVYQFWSDRSNHSGFVILTNNSSIDKKSATVFRYSAKYQYITLSNSLSVYDEALNNDHTHREFMIVPIIQLIRERWLQIRLEFTKQCYELDYLILPLIEIVLEYFQGDTEIITLLLISKQLIPDKVLQTHYQ